MTLVVKYFGYENICLFKQDNNAADRIIKLRNVYFPSKIEENRIEFKLNSFSFAFIASFNTKTIDCDSRLELDGFRMNPILNYIFNCENLTCRAHSHECTSVGVGYGQFQLNVDFVRQSATVAKIFFL